MEKGSLCRRIVKIADFSKLLQQIVENFVSSPSHFDFFRAKKTQQKNLSKQNSQSCGRGGVGLGAGLAGLDVARATDSNGLGEAELWQRGLRGRANAAEDSAWKGEER
jgi:hypothetical protein